MIGWLPDTWCCDSVFNSPNIDMLITWLLISDTWYLTCYHLTPDTWHLTYYHRYMTLTTWYWYTWPDAAIPDLILSHLTDYIAYSWLLFLRGLDMIIILLLDIWYSWTPILMNSCTPEPLKHGDSWYYTHDTILPLILVNRSSWTNL